MDGLPMHRHLLILSCSARKRSAPGLCPAVERYDGPFFRVLRKALRESVGRYALDVEILSAEFGIIDAGCEIPDRDRRMSTRRAKEFPFAAGPALAARVRDGHYSDVLQRLGASWESLDRMGGLVREYRCRDDPYGRAAISLNPIVRAEESLGSLFADADMFIAQFYSRTQV